MESQPVRLESMHCGLLEKRVMNVAKDQECKECLL